MFCEVMDTQYPVAINFALRFGNQTLMMGGIILRHFLLKGIFPICAQLSSGIR